MAGLARSEGVRGVVGQAVDLAHDLGLPVVGEGIETLDQLSILGALGCDQGQGYVFAYPRPVAELTASLV